MQLQFQVKKSKTPLNTCQREKLVVEGIYSIGRACVNGIHDKTISATEKLTKLEWYRAIRQIIYWSIECCIDQIQPFGE
jgi:hypothetical protein